MGKFEDEGMIGQVYSEGRKRYYQITEKGYGMLKKEYERLQRLVQEGRMLLERQEGEYVWMDDTAKDL